MVEANPQDPKKDPRVSEEKRVADEKKHAADTRAARRKRRRILSVIGIIFCVLALLYLIYWLIWARFEEYTDDAYVNGNLVRLMPQVSGTITSIYTDDTQYVQQGQTVIQLDNSDMLITLERMKAELAQAVRSVTELYNNVLQAE
jgi:membrane fusion protein (multidrug efflux system)